MLYSPNKKKFSCIFPKKKFLIFQDGIFQPQSQKNIKNPTMKKFVTFFQKTISPHFEMTADQAEK